MIRKSADAIADYLIKHDAIVEADKELYSYAIYSALLSVSPLVLAVGFGICMGCVMQSVVLILPFMVIRKFSGGYHTKHLITCFISSCLLLLLCIGLAIHLSYGWELFVITTAAAVNLLFSSPIDHENRRLSNEERISYKKITVMLVVACISVDALFYICGLPAYSVCVSIGIILTAGLQLPCIFRTLYIHMKKRPKTLKKCRLVQNGLKLRRKERQ